MLVLETWEQARERGAKVYAELTGYGASSDAHHVTQPAPEHEGAQRSMKLALADAGLKPADIGYINAHGTSTDLGDVLEMAGIARVFGESAHKVAVSSTKSMTGHMNGAAGAAEAVISVLALQRQDPRITLDCIPNVAREQRVDAVMSNSFGFGGTNVSLVFQRPA
jgi:3-oxoacyl-[acyl-carrier-protein] synthase II